MPSLNPSAKSVVDKARRPGCLEINHRNIGDPEPPVGPVGTVSGPAKPNPMNPKNMYHPKPRMLMKPRLGAAAFAILTTSSYAGSYTTDFTTDPTLPGLPAAQRLTILTNSNAGWVGTGGNPGGYLRLTDPVNGASAVVFFPDFEAGFVVGGFQFAMDARIGGGTGTPADGFSVSFARDTDPVLSATTNGAAQAAFATGVPEEGTTTGIAICFDAYFSGGEDVIGFSVRVDGVVITQVSLPTLNGAVDDPTSLQTGPAGGVAGLGWARFEVDLQQDGTLDVTWKGTPVIEDLPTGYFPSKGRLVFAARTGGLNQAHHFDNLTLTTEPVPLAVVSNAELNDGLFRFEIKDFGTSSVVTPENFGGLSIGGETIETPTSITKEAGSDITVVTYQSPDPLPPATAFTYQVFFYDTNDETIIGEGSLRTPALLAGSLPGPEGAVGTWGIREFYNPPPPIDPLDPEPAAGTIGDASAIAAAEEAGTFVEDTSVPVLNHSDPDTNGPAAAGNFNNDFPILTNTADDDNWVVVAKTKLDIPAAGVYTFSVHSDDGFALRIDGPQGGRFIADHGTGAVDPRDEQVIFLDGGSGDSNTRGVYQFDAAGIYDVTYLGWDGGGGGYHELAWAEGEFTHDRETDTWTLVGSPNDPSVPDFRPSYVEVLPGPPATDGNFSIRTYLEANVGGNLVGASNFVRDTVRSPSDATPLTVDVQRSTLDAVDPGFGGQYTFPNTPPFPGDTVGVDDNNVVTVAKGRITIPSAGSYTFWARSDDGFLLRLTGVGGNPDPAFDRATQGGNAAAATAGTVRMSNRNELIFGDGTGDADTRGIIDLQAGTYDLDYINWEGGGGFGYELSAAVGSWPHGTTPPTGWFLVGSVPAVDQLVVPRISASGWTVESSNAGRGELIPPPGGTGTFDIAGAELAIDNALTEGVGSTTTWDLLDFTDPEAGNAGQFPGSNPWPLNTPVDDNQYAMRATGTLVITEPGVYHLGFQGDDGGYMQIDGPLEGTNTAEWSSIVDTLHPTVAIIVPGDSGSGFNNRLQAELGTGNSRTIGAINLVAGTYTITTLVYEGGGGSWWEVVGAKAPEVTLPANFAYPLLARAEGSLYQVPSGIRLVAQEAGEGTPPGTFIAVNDFDVTGGAPVTSISLTFNSEAGRTYKILASTNLVDWIEVAAAVPASGGATTEFVVDPTTIPAIDGEPKVFFRVVIN